MKKKVIIIGSGLGGLSTGLILAKNGYDVTILEQGAQAGGCLQCFYRGGVKFETGMHFIGSADKGQTLFRLMNYLELNDVELSRLDPSGYDVISLAGKRYRFANGKEVFIDELLKSFPHQKDNLDAYFNLIEKVSQASSLHSLRTAESDTAVCTEFQMRSINDVIENTISDPILQKVLVGNLPLYAAEFNKTPFSTHAFITDFYNQSSFRIVGGSDMITKSLVRNLQKYGANVILRSKVTKIVCDDERAIGVTTDKGAYLEADYIISSIHPTRTMELVDSRLIRPVFRRRLMSVPNTVGGFSVYLKFKKDYLPYMNYNFYGYTSDTPWECENYNEENWPKGYLYMHLCHEPNPEYARSGVILSYMRIEELSRWKNTKVGLRGYLYEEFKEEKARILIDRVSEEFPELKDAIEGYYTSTPLTYRDYTGTEGGSLYGVAKDVNCINECRVPHRTRIPNLLLTGQNINSHGMLGVLVGSIVTCSEFLTAEEIYQQILTAENE